MTVVLLRNFSRIRVDVLELESHLTSSTMVPNFELEGLCGVVGNEFDILDSVHKIFWPKVFSIRNLHTQRKMV